MLNKTVKGKKMKLSTLVTIASVALLTACASTQPQVAQPAPQYQHQYVPQSAHTYAMQVEPTRAKAPPPSWMTRLPQDTPDMVFSASSARSKREQGAYDQAQMNAEAKLCDMLAGRVKTNTKRYSLDTGDNLVERFESSSNKSADCELIGAQRVDSQVSFDGRDYTVYVLMRYPLAESNPLRKEREQAKLKREGELRARKAEQDMERESERNRQAQERADERMRQEIGVRPERTETVAPAVRGPESVPTSEGELKLLEVDNKEYKQRRAEAMQKEGAVVGNSTMR